jgi:uncharacterized protein YndB with AHSA1/START domain
MKKWLIIALAVVIGLPLVAAAIGMFIPRDHEARMTIDLAAAPDRVWALVSDFANTPKWRSDVKSIVMEPSNLRFTESSSMGDVTFEILTQEPPARQVVKVVDDNQPFGGTWTWQIDPNGSGSRVTITEAGFVKNPIFRALGAIFFSPTDSIASYLRALAKALGETAEPRIVTG